MLKIEAGKTYLTRDGQKASILAHADKCKYPFVGVIDGSWCTWLDGGQVSLIAQTDRDLVKEFAEPREVWVICTERGTIVGFFNSEDDAKNHVMGFPYTRIIKKFIEVV